MGKIEKTLELNITHELLSLADSFWWYLQPISLKRFWRPHWRFPLIQLPHSFATGLHINLEGKSNGGYDVCIKSPSNFRGGNPRLLFMQFKAGVEQPFNNNSKSIFYGNASKPNVHVEFDINSNKKRNQHKLLQNLAANAGNKDATVYVFPRIVNISQLEQNLGKLLSKTSFVSISEIDAKASDNGVTIDDGNAHKFRTCYNDFDKNEVNFFFFFFGKQEQPGGLMGEIMAIRMFRALQSLKEVQQNNYPISRFHIIDAMIRHVMNIGLYFSIPYWEAIQPLNNLKVFNKRLILFEDYEDLSKGYTTQVEASKYETEVFGNIAQSMTTYFNWIEGIGNFTKETKIPTPPSNFTIDIAENGLRFGLDLNNKTFNKEDFDEIFYQLI